MESILQDSRIALRMLRKHPGPSGVVVATLALAIGLNAGMFSIVNALLLRPLPYPQPNDLVQIRKEWRPPWLSQIEVTSRLDLPEILAWREKNGALSQLAFYDSQSVRLNDQANGEFAQCGRVSGSFFSTLGAIPALGRTFLPEEEQFGGPTVAVLSRQCWKRRFGEDPGIIGRTINLDGKSYSVIGVLASSFRFTEPYDVYIPLPLRPDVYVNPQVVGRLKPEWHGVSV